MFIQAFKANMQLNAIMDPKACWAIVCSPNSSIWKYIIGKLWLKKQNKQQLSQVFLTSLPPSLYNFSFAYKNLHHRLTCLRKFSQANKCTAFWQVENRYHWTWFTIKPLSMCVYSVPFSQWFIVSYYFLSSLSLTAVTKICFLQIKVEILSTLNSVYSNIFSQTISIFSRFVFLYWIHHKTIRKHCLYKDFRKPFKIFHLLLAKTFGLLNGEGKLLHQLFIALVGW